MYVTPVFRTNTPIPSVAAIAVLWALHGCSPPCAGGVWQPARSIDLGTNANLRAVAAPTFPIGAVAPAMVVGSGGTVLTWAVEWGNSFDGEPDVEAFDLADVELRAVTDAGEGRWVVVGDGGFAAVTDDSGQTWATLDLGTSANFYAAFAVEDRVVVVGDEVVRVLETDNTWLEPAAPQGGWGQLRAGGWTAQYGEGPSTFVVGLGGVIASTSDPSGVWLAEDSGVSVDLFAVGRLHLTAAAVGANGTFLVRDAGEWSSMETERTVDFVDYQEVDPYGVLLAADGEILQFELYHLSEGFRHIDRIEGARDLVAQPVIPGLIVVGDAGLAVSIELVLCGGH